MMSLNEDEKIFKIFKGSNKYMIKKIQDTDIED